MHFIETRLIRLADLHRVLMSKKHALTLCSVATMAVFDGQVFAATLFLIIVTLNYGTCLHCYSCSSGPDELCDDKFSFEAHRVVQVMSCEYSPLLSKPGAGPNTHCGKSKRFDKNPSVDNKDYVFRGCVPENYCRLVKNEVSDCEICETERCNSSPAILPSCMFLISLLLVKFVSC